MIVFVIVTPVIQDLIVTLVIVIVIVTLEIVIAIGALEIVIAIVTLDMTHEDSENLLGEAQTFSLERATPLSVIDPWGGFRSFHV